jgi:hypothetical protein
MNRRRWWQESPITRESTKETVKTIARGMPDCFGEPVVTMLVRLFQFACEAAGATSTRHSLRPLLLRALFNNSGAFVPREGGGASGALATSPSSWPGLTRPSTPLFLEKKEDVDHRDKPGDSGL